MADITIKLYDVTGDSGNFLPACRDIFAMPDEKKDILIGGYPVRMEQFFPCGEGGNLYMMDFAQRRGE